MNRLVIIGASGHGKVIADIAKKNGYKDIIFLDDNPNTKQCGTYAVCGGCDNAESYKDADFIVAIGNNSYRRNVQSSLKDKGLKVVSLIHPAAVVASSATVGAGTVIMAGAVVAPYAILGEGCIVNTCASVDHDCVAGDYVHIAVGVHMAGSVSIGEDTMVGAGATIINNITICKNCIIGAGAVVVRDMVEPGTYVGTPAKLIKRHLCDI